jgi:hypothetical protein
MFPAEIFLCDYGGSFADFRPCAKHARQKDPRSEKLASRVEDETRSSRRRDAEQSEAVRDTVQCFSFISMFQHQFLPNAERLKELMFPGRRTGAKQKCSEARQARDGTRVLLSKKISIFWTKDDESALTGSAHPEWRVRSALSTCAWSLRLKLRLKCKSL